MRRFTVTFTPEGPGGFRKTWIYERDEFLCEIVHIKHGKYGIYGFVKYGEKHKLLHTEYTTNLRDAKRIAREFVES